MLGAVGCDQSRLAVSAHLLPAMSSADPQYPGRAALPRVPGPCPASEGNRPAHQHSPGEAVGWHEATGSTVAQDWRFDDEQFWRKRGKEQRTG